MNLSETILTTLIIAFVVPFVGVFTYIKLCDSQADRYARIINDLTLMSNIENAELTQKLEIITSILQMEYFTSADRVVAVKAIVDPHNSWHMPA